MRNDRSRIIFHITPNQSNVLTPDRMIIKLFCQLSHGDVIFCEHKFLYNRLKSDSLPETGLPYNTARVARFGRDITIVAYSAMIHDALAAADLLRKEGTEVEVIDRQQP